MAKQTKEDLLVETEKLRMNKEELLNELKLADEHDEQVREEITRILTGNPRREDDYSFSSRGIGKLETYSWLKITCEIGKLLSKTQAFDLRESVAENESRINGVEKFLKNLTSEDREKSCGCDC